MILTRYVFTIMAFLFLFVLIYDVHGESLANNYDRLIKGSRSSLYYYAFDGKRYVFPTEGTYNSWFGDREQYIREVSDEILATYPLGGNVTYRPAYKMIKITTDPKVYVVEKGGVLRWVTSEEIARELYGDDWGAKIDDVADAFFTNYTIGEPIHQGDDIKLFNVFMETQSINADKDIFSLQEPLTKARNDFLGITKVDCEIITNSVFHSTEKYEMGFDPKRGVIYDYWKIYFGEHEDIYHEALPWTQGETAFEFQYSDVLFSGTYTCENNVIRVRNENGEIRHFVHNFDPDIKILSWNNRDYMQVSEPSVSE